MLVLTRRIGETLIIGGNIVVTVVSIDRGQVRLGIEAPKDIPILRGELVPATPAPANEPQKP